MLKSSVWVIAVTLVILLTGCAAPEPSPTPTPEPVQVTNITDLVGIYIHPDSTFGDRFIQIDEDGTLTYARGKPENLKDQATFVSETHFNSRLYYVKMTDTTFPDYAKCIGLDSTSDYGSIYKIWRQANGDLTFDPKVEGCARRVNALVGAWDSDIPLEWQPYP